MKIYITFGQIHAHAVNGVTFDKDCVCEIECDSYEEGRRKAFEAFGDKFGTSYGENELERLLPYFPRGVIALEGGYE